MKDKFYFSKINISMMIIAIVTIVLGYIIMGHHRTPKILAEDIKSSELLNNDIKIAKDSFNLEFLKSIKGEQSAIELINRIIESQNFLSDKIISEIDLPAHAKVILEKVNREKNPDNVKYRYSESDYINFYKLLNSREKSVVNRYVIEQVVPNSINKYINQTGENTFSVILIIIGYVILVPLAIIYRKRN